MELWGYILHKKSMRLYFKEAIASFQPSQEQPPSLSFSAILTYTYLLRTFSIKADKQLLNHPNMERR